MIGSLAALPLPGSLGEPASSHRHIDPLCDRLFTEHRVEIPVFGWPALGRRLIRLSAHLYNGPDDYAALARVLPSAMSAAGGAVPSPARRAPS